MSPTKIILIVVVVVIYVALLREISRTTETRNKDKEDKKVQRPMSKKDKIMMVITASGIGGLLVKYIVEWQ
jgi:preprotein translocase subunit YajC